MKVSVSSSFQKRTSSDLLVVPFWQHKGKAEPAQPLGGLKATLQPALALGDFTAKSAECLLIYGTGKKEKRYLLLGLGEKKNVTTEEVRCAYAAVSAVVKKHKIRDIALWFPDKTDLKSTDFATAAMEGVLLSNYAFTLHKEEQQVLLRSLQLIGSDKQIQKKAERTVKAVEAVHFSRDLVNSNADLITPQYLAETAKKLAKTFPKVKTTVLTKKQIEKEKMGLLLAVNRGSPRDPVLITLEYKGAPKSKEKTVIVGKGITYDTGGLSLKPTSGMLSMKSDMGGAAAALGTIKAVASLGLKVNVIAVIPSTENGIDGCSYKPGDTYTSHNGKTVEIANTDAEGRLILADALSYAEKKYKPTRIIDFATLTGSIVVALGEGTSGLFSENDALADQLIAAGSQTDEKVWRMPMYKEHRDRLQSDFADFKNLGGREGGACVAACFLREFVGKTPWAHIDIAGPAYLTKELGYQPKNGTGVGVRLMVSFLESSGGAT